MVYSTGVPKIIDEFTDLPITKIKRYQLRRKKAGKCRCCFRPKVPGKAYCEKHLIGLAKTVAAQKAVKRMLKRTKSILDPIK